MQLHAPSTPQTSIPSVKQKRKKPIEWQPSYRLHAASGQAVVTIDGKDHYLGEHGSQASRTRYNTLIADWRANGCRLPSTTPQEQLLIKELVLAFWRHAKAYYVTDDGTPTTERLVFKSVLRLLRR
jgi:hypothetical protein